MQSAADFSAFRKRAEHEFLSLLKSITGDKELIISKELFRKIDRITNVNALRENNVKRILTLAPNIGTSNYLRVFFARGNLDNFRFVVDVIQKHSQPILETVHIICVPRIIYNVRVLLEQEGLLERVMLHSLPSWELIYIDRDLLSMGMDVFFARTFLNHDCSWLSSVASSLVNIQALFTCKINSVYAMGDRSKKVYDMMSVMMEQEKKNAAASSRLRDFQLGSSSNGSDRRNEFSSTRMATFVPEGAGENAISHMVIVDRSLDYNTIFSSQMIYEGLIDESFKINAGMVSVPNEVLKTKPPDKQTLMVLSEDSDPIYSKLRGLHITRLFTKIRSYGQTIRQEIDSRKEEIKSKNIGEIKLIVKNDLKAVLDKERLLQRHMALSEFIMDVKRQTNFRDQLEVERNILARTDYESCINFIKIRMLRGLLWSRTLQLMCLLSVSYDGIPFSDMEVLRRLFLSSYGYDHLPLIISLEKLGVLKYQSSKGLFATLCRKCHLVPSIEPPSSSGTPPQEDRGADLAYASTMALSSVFDGFYVPLLCRLVEYQLYNSAVIDEISQDLNESFFASDSARSLRHHILARAFAPTTTSTAPTAGKHSLVTEQQQQQQQQHFQQKPTILIVFVGGCTYTEINALRLLSGARGCNILMFTTDIFTNERLFDQLVDSSL